MSFGTSRKAAFIKLAILPIPMIVMLALVLMENAGGLDAGHPMEYLVATCVLWAILIEILPLLRIARIFSLPFFFEVILYANIYLYVIALCEGLYLNISWWGDVTHILSSALVACFVFLVICMIETKLPSYTNMGGRAGITAITFLISMSFGGIWEIMEGATDFFSGYAYMVYGATDTLGDMTADLAGVTITTILVYFVLGRTASGDIAKDVRFGKSAFDGE